MVTTFLTPTTRARDLTLLTDVVNDGQPQIDARPEPMVGSFHSAKKALPVSV